MGRSHLYTGRTAFFSSASGTTFLKGMGTHEKKTLVSPRCLGRLRDICRQRKSNSSRGGGEVRMKKL